MRQCMQFCRAGGMFCGAMVVLFMVSACMQTPKPNPAAMMQDGDRGLSCADFLTEYTVNTTVAEEKIAENNRADAHDVFMALFVSPLLIDMNNAPGHEGNALLDRNKRVKSLAEVKGCDLTNLPAQPERYGSGVPDAATEENEEVDDY